MTFVLLFGEQKNTPEERGWCPPRSCEREREPDAKASSSWIPGATLMMSRTYTFLSPRNWSAHPQLIGGNRT